MIDIDLRRAVIPLALFFGTFAWSSVYVSLPCYLSGGDAASALWWTGWILGITPLLTVMMAPVWGRLAGRRDPKVFYVAAQSLQGVAFFVGPVVATPVLAWTSPAALYVVLAALGLACVPFAGRGVRVGREAVP